MMEFLGKVTTGEKEISNEICTGSNQLQIENVR